MIEETINLNTDLKELFVALKIDETINVLDKESDDIVKEITLYNYEIIKNYYESEKYAVLLQHIKFVAYSSFLCEYSVKRQIINNADYEDMSTLFENILILKQQSEQ